MLIALGWLESQGGEVNARSETLRMASDEKLRARLRLLRSLMSRPRDYLKEVFQSDDPKWIDQCKAIIK
jgi:hypothetical protein